MCVTPNPCSLITACRLRHHGAAGEEEEEEEEEVPGGSGVGLELDFGPEWRHHLSPH